MQRSLLLIFALSLIPLGLSCAGSQGAVSGDSPTEAYKRLFAAVKSKDTEAIKKNLTKKSIDFAAFSSQRNGTALERVFENGLTASTFSDTLPPIRDERLNGDMGAIEVWNSKESRWEDLGFIKEDGSWKLAIGDIFGGTFRSPGKGRDQREKEAANAMANASATPIASAPSNAVPQLMPPNKNGK